jgi:hypothetical protein
LSKYIVSDLAAQAAQIRLRQRKYGLAASDMG